MCRIVGIIGRYSIIKQYVSELIKGFVGASEYDPYSVKAFGLEDSSHRDGWGRATVFIGMHKTSTYIYRSLSPVFIDKPQESLPRSELLRFSDLVIVDILHSRAGSSDTPINYFSVQPFETYTRSGARLILTHNGSVNKEDLIKDLGYELSRKLIERYSDSYLLTLKLAELIEDELNINAIKELKKYVKTALNIGTIVIADNKMTVVFGSYYNEKLPRKFWDYYKMYVAKTNKSYLIYASSTIVDFNEYRPKSIGNWEEIPNGTYYFVKIETSIGEDIEVSIEEHSI